MSIFLTHLAMVLRVGPESSAADYDVPAAYAPTGNEAICDIRVAFREARRRRRVVATKHQGGTVNRIRKSSGHDKFASAMGLLDQFQMFWSNRRAPVDEIVNHFV